MKIPVRAGDLRTCTRDRTLDASRRVNFHAIDATLDGHPAPTQDVPKRCHACSKGVGIALRNWSGLAKAILGLFFLLICT